MPEPKRLTCPADDASSTVDLDTLTKAQIVQHIANQLNLRYNVIGDKQFLALPDEEERLVLPVTYYYQFDSATPHGARMCNSTSNAMLLKHLKRGALTDSFNADDEYLMRVHQYGDTTEPLAQQAALRHFGIKATFRTDLDWPDVIAQLKRGIPVPIGLLHHGHVSYPTGGGHWICIVGYDGDDFIVHDPAGEMDLVNGGYPSSRSGKFVRYSRKNLTPRWRVRGTGGWGMTVQ